MQYCPLDPKGVAATTVVPECDVRSVEPKPGGNVPDTAVSDELLASLHHLSDNLQVKRTWRRGADQVVCDEIVAALGNVGGVVTAGNAAELRDKLKLMQYSTTKVKRAVGSLISRGIVIRRRRWSDEPVTLRLNV